MYKILFIAISVNFLPSCGEDGNIFYSIDPPLTSEIATKYLEKNESQKAIDTILTELGMDYQNTYNQAKKVDANLTEYTSELNTQLSLAKNSGVNDVANLVSILASAVAQKWGIDTLDIVLNLASSSSGTSNSNAITALFPILPEATVERIHGVRLAITLLNSMGNEIRDADKFKLGIYMTSAMSLSLKIIDLDGDGLFSSLETSGINEATATLVINMLTDAASVLEALVKSEASKDSQTSNATSSLSTTRDQIKNSVGSDTTEKLQDFLNKN